MSGLSQKGCPMNGSAPASLGASLINTSALGGMARLSFRPVRVSSLDCFQTLMVWVRSSRLGVRAAVTNVPVRHRGHLSTTADDARAPGDLGRPDDRGIWSPMGWLDCW